jgi:threonyl-tRNA synthetase
MPTIRLPDGSERTFDQPVTIAEIAADIGPGLAKVAIGGKVDGELCDLSRSVVDDAAIQIVTIKDRDGSSSDDALFLIRHSCAHVMAEAIQRILPGVRLVYGPPVEGGFYYDMAIPDGKAISTENFEAIEAEMAKIVAEDRAFQRVEIAVAEGLEKLESEGSKYKLDNAQRAVDAGSDSLSWYVTGEPDKDWEDLCRGPHVPSTGKIPAFKIMSVASSYWHGDANSDSLTRVYGTAFGHKKQLDKHLELLEESRKRDHRVLGKQLQLFHIDEAVGQGLILWTPNGAVVRGELERFIRNELTKMGYDSVYTPHIGKLELYKTSGHFPYYSESQYPPLIEADHIEDLAAAEKTCGDLANLMKEGEVQGYLLKPMNCPHHIKIYSSQARSYRDLPVRLAEFGTVYRWEQSGEIGGLTRVRGFTQDDAHLFCTEDQVAQELQGCLKLVKIIFEKLDMKDYRVRVGLRDVDSTKYVGDPARWDRAETACREAAQSLGVEFSEENGEAAFYGPKIDFIVRDVVGREWQLGTVQVDYNLPERFDLKYTGADNALHRPVMIHRAPFGSMERFVGVLIEHFAGAFPTWLAPEQVRVLPISNKNLEYANKVLAALLDTGIRCSLDDSNDRIQAKVRAAAEWKIPYLLVLGPRDAENGEVSVRARGIRKDLGALPLETFVSTIARENSTRGNVNVVAEHFADQADADQGD